MNHIDRRETQTHDEYAATDLETMQGARRYGDHIFNLMRPHMGRRILEVGSGIGTMTARLLEVADQVVAIEPNPYCVTRTRDAIGDHPRFRMYTQMIEECDAVELASYRLDTVYCSNVLEHIEDDAEALRTFARVIVPGGRILIFVPAVSAAYGPLDAELGHFRRYSKSTLAKAFADANVRLELLRYTNPIGLAGWMFNSHVTKSREHSPAQVKLFETFVAPWALPLEAVIPPPIGLSLVAVGRTDERAAGA